MDVRRAPIEGRDQLGQREVVSRDQTDRARIDERPHDRFSADAAVVGVGAVQDLIEQKQQRPALARQPDDGADPEDLRVEP